MKINEYLTHAHNFESRSHGKKQLKQQRAAFYNKKVTSNRMKTQQINTQIYILPFEPVTTNLIT